MFYHISLISFQNEKRSDKSCKENQNTGLGSKNIFSPEYSAVCEIMWKNIIGRGRLQMTIWRLRIACWVTKATNTHSLYVILIAFPLQKPSHERASVLHHAYLACLVTPVHNSTLCSS